MSTKKIREALRTLGFTHDVSAALAEVEAIEKAAGDIEAWQTEPHGFGRTAAAKDATWAFELMSDIAKEAGK